MVSLNFENSFLLDPNLSSISDLEIAWIDGVPMLYVASQASGGMTVYSLDGGVIYSDQIGYSNARGTSGVNDIDIITVNGQTVLIPSGRYDDRLAFHLLDNNGDFDGLRTLGADTSLIGNFEHSIQIFIDGKTFLIASQMGKEGFRSARIRDDLSMEHKRHFEDNNQAHIGDVTAMVSAEFATRSFFFVASGQDAGVTAYWMGEYGNIKERGSVGPESGLGISYSSALETAIIDGQFFLFLGSAGTGTITTIRVNQWGGLFVEENYMDDRNSRFDGVRALESFSIGDRSFLIAGGSDDGVTLFEIDPGGRLNMIQVIEDSTDMTLTNITAITATVDGNDVYVFVAGSETGFTQFSLNFDGLGDLITGDDSANTINGTNDDDLIAGYDGNDILSGRSGDDRIIDGAGADIMKGNNGKDTFVFVDDGRMDTVLDFKPNTDKLDLTAFDMLYTIDQLVFVQKDYGVLISYGDDRFRLENEGYQLTIGDLDANDFIF